MNTDHKSFIEELRTLGEPVKSKILFGTAAVSMIVVISLWLAYFNTIVPSAVPITAQAPAAAVAQDTGGPGIFGLLADAASSFWGSALGGVQGIVGALKNPKQYDISPK
jgi:hypothetical protein